MGSGARNVGARKAQKRSRGLVKMYGGFEKLTYRLSPLRPSLARLPTSKLDRLVLLTH